MFGRIKDNFKSIKGDKIVENIEKDSALFSNKFFNNSLYNVESQYINIGKEHIRPHINIISKAKPLLKIKSETIENDFITKMTYFPNEFDTFQDLIEKIVTQYKLYNNAFIIVYKDSNNNSLFSTMEVLTGDIEYSYGVGKNGEYLYNFKYERKGEKINGYYPLKNVIHIKKDVGIDGIFGENPLDIIEPLLKVSALNNENIEKAIKSNINIKHYASATGVTDTTSVAGRMMKAIEKSENLIDMTGIAVVPHGFNIKALPSIKTLQDSKQVDTVEERIMNFYGVNKSILNNNFTEEEWNSFYEIEIIPILTKISTAFTRNLFSLDMIRKGYKLELDTSSLNYSNLDTKIKFAGLGDKGLLTKNEIRKELGYTTTEDGDTFYRRLDTDVIDSKTGEFKNKIRN